MDRDRILAGLNAEQRRAAEAVRGPVCILAGAGSGKTTTITRRIANQVATGAFHPTSILAVTFSDKAASEMRERLAALGAGRVVARTFHSAALRQLHYFARRDVPQLLPSKALLLQPVRASLPRPYRFRPLRDLATEIEWAKNRRLTPGTYLESLDGHEPPMPPDLALRVFREYERRKERHGRIDFEDVLELAIRLFDEDESARDRFREQYRAFTVDEYQDVNLLQQSLLERWLGDGDELCVVGDDYQSIYSFTGATPRYLLALPDRFPHATVVRLEENYRSTPQVLAFANRLVPRLGGARKVLRPVCPDGPDPSVRAFATREQEVTFVVDEARGLNERCGVPYEEIAVLYRLNARSDDFEGAFARAGIPFQVRDGAFLARPAARQIVRVLARLGPEARVAEAVRRAAEQHGLAERLPGEIGDEEATRQADLRRLVELAEEFDDGGSTVADFVVDLRSRFGAETEGRGVHLLTYHRAKGLEFGAVFLPRLEEGELPYGRSKRDERLGEERRLLYVGLTRAKRHLYVTWVSSEKPSRFLRELGESNVAVKPANGAGREPAFDDLKAWRLRRAKADGVPAYVVFHDTTLAEIARSSPRTLPELAAVPGVGPAKLVRYGAEVLEVLK